MKNPFLLAIIPVLLAMPVTSFAVEFTRTSISATVFVQGSFTLMVNTDSFDFARLSPGGTGEINRIEGVIVSGASSGGSPWYLKVSTLRPLSSGSDFIPNDNFTWYGTTEGRGNWNGYAAKSFSDKNNTAYASTIDEADSAEKVANKFFFRLHVPEETKQGVYTTTVMFTMTE